MGTKQLPTGVYVEEMNDCVRLFSLADDLSTITIHAMVPMELFFASYGDGLPSWDDIPYIHLPEFPRFINHIWEPGWDKEIKEKF